MRKLHKLSFDQAQFLFYFSDRLGFSRETADTVFFSLSLFFLVACYVAYPTHSKWQVFISQSCVFWLKAENISKASIRERLASAAKLLALDFVSVHEAADICLDKSANGGLLAPKLTTQSLLSHECPCEEQLSVCLQTPETHFPSCSRRVPMRDPVNPNSEQLAAVLSSLTAQWVCVLVKPPVFSHSLISGNGKQRNGLGTSRALVRPINTLLHELSTEESNHHERRGTA